jgi:hypothetical protein
MGVVFTDDCILEEEDVVLPELGSGMPPPDVIVFRQSLGQKIDLKMVSLLGGDKIRNVLLKKLHHAFFAMVPSVGPVVCETESQIQ